MSASAFLERSKASLGELKLHVPPLRARASSSPLRLHLPCIGLGIASCGGGSDGVSISRSFTAPGQAPSARREASDHGNAGSAEQHQPSLSSPIEMQQYRAVPEGHPYRYLGRSEERLVPANGNPEREDEYLPYSFPPPVSERQQGAVEARRSADVRPPDAGLADVGLADADAGMRRQVISQAYSTGNDAWMRTIENAAQARLPQSRIRGTVVPVWEVDVEAQLEGEMQQLIGARDYRFGELVVERAPPAISRPPAPPPTTLQPPAPQPRPHRPHHDPSKRKARIFNPEIDYTILHPHPNPTPETISPHLSTQDLASLQITSPIASAADADTTYHQTDTSRYKTLITPTSQQGRKLHLPHPPPPASSTRQLDIIQARILDAETGRQVTYPALNPPTNHKRQTAASRSGGRAEIRGEMSPPTVDGSTLQPLPPTTPNTAPEDFPLLVQAMDIGTGVASSIRAKNHADPSPDSPPPQSQQHHHHHHRPQQRNKNRTRIQQQAADLILQQPPTIPTANSVSSPNCQPPSPLPRPSQREGSLNPPLPPPPMRETLLPPLSPLSPLTPLPPPPPSTRDENPNTESEDTNSSISSGWRSNLSLPSPPPTPPSTPLSSITAGTPPPLPPATTAPTRTGTAKTAGEMGVQAWKRLTVNTATWGVFPGEWALAWG